MIVEKEGEVNMEGYEDEVIIYSNGKHLYYNSCEHHKPRRVPRDKEEEIRRKLDRSKFDFYKKPFE